MQSGNFIKAFKNIRLLIHAPAYMMFVRLGDYLWGTPWQKLQVKTLRRRLLKVGARVR